MRRLYGLAALLLLFSGMASAQVTATYDAATSTLTMSSVKVDSAMSVANVVVRFASFGTLKVDDTTVGSDITFDSKTNTIRLPSVKVGTATYNKVSLANPLFTLVSIGAVTVIAPPTTSSNYNLDITVTAAGTNFTSRVANVPKPSAQADFCAPAIYQQFQQSVQGATGTWSITSCSFDGTTGTISAKMTISTGFFSTAIDYTVTYKYSPA